MDPRQLVGMTQGAKKRAARPKIVRNDHAWLAKHRALYRVGERLRPCPWCSRGGDPAYCAKTRKMLKPPYSICDGSGVLPTRKAARAKAAARAKGAQEYIAAFETLAGGELQPCCIDYAWDRSMKGESGHHPMCPMLAAPKGEGH